MGRDSIPGAHARAFDRSVLPIPEPGVLVLTIHTLSHTRMAPRALGRERFLTDDRAKGIGSVLDR